ncbi:type VII secretion-associated serine protease mycosin [Corynebacterium kutscheri]|uniref:Type VII secretion-associated serine protease mycosin n=1 Tax=Corynebacterium kutscheri TaxID=35755 RepID=A0A0F6QYJ2_9CORY|nr:type VII secretion-associated serine protease mycosin [Corynebacterium kutscheri]AKE40607.1 type VII secretion-associated serine protease mycosin [Corynebacterium kutscheri]VEH11004.1 peptidase S8 and S53, subtilisin, kexin, sedolisin [Corynebacterium kutscheri]
MRIFTVFIALAISVGLGIATISLSPVVAHVNAQPNCPNSQPATAEALNQQAHISDNIRKAHSFATGKGIKVAVIDTGVANHPRLGGVINGGDLLGHGNSYDDCDGHGTIVAGIIAARPGDDDIIGVAPDAQIISIRQSSSLLHRADNPHVSGTLDTLGDAIVLAVEQGAQVINTSVVACIPPGTPDVDTTSFDAAIHRAEEAGVVIVSSLGNTTPECPQNSTIYPAHHPLVLGVGANVDPYYQTDYTLVTPHKHLSALGSCPAGLSPRGDGMAMGLLQGQNFTPFEGTSFAAPAVSGLVALIKQRYPHYSPAQLREYLFAAVDPSTGFIDIPHALGLIDAYPIPKPDYQPQALVVEKQTPRVFIKHTALFFGIIAGLIFFFIIAAEKFRR